MTDPKQDPSATPGAERVDPRRPQETVETGPFYASWRARQRTAGDGSEWAAWGWAGGGPRGVPWLGVLLVLLGIAFLIQKLAPGVSFGSLFLLALGLAFGAAWIIGGWRGATVPSLVLLALAGARLLGEVTGERSEGWTPLFLGVALMIAWVAGQLQGARRDWALWLGLILAVYGLVQIWSVVPGLPDLGWVWPVVLIVAGSALLLRRRVD